MSENGRRYLFKGHAVGVAAQFHRLGELEGLDHAVPAQGAAVLPVTGGLSHAKTEKYDYPVCEPWRRKLVEVGLVESKARGERKTDGFLTEVQSRVEDLHVLEKLHFRLVEVHLSSFKYGDEPPAVRTTGAHIEGMRLNDVHVTVKLDTVMLAHCGSKKQLAEFCSNNGGVEFCEHDGNYLSTLVREIQLSGPPDEVAKIPKPVGNRIYWPGFGRIYLGEVLVGERERRVTMVRLDMGSDAGGSGAIGDAGTNGSTSM